MNTENDKSVKNTKCNFLAQKMTKIMKRNLECRNTDRSCKKNTLICSKIGPIFFRALLQRNVESNF